MPPKTSSDDFRPDPSRGNASDAGPIQDPSIKFLATWRPDAEFGSKDVRRCVINPAERNGEYGTQDGSNPWQDQRTAGTLDSEFLLTGGVQGGKCRYPR